MKPTVEKITSDGEIVAIIIRSHFEEKGVNFLSPDKFSFQLGVNSYKKGEIVKSHTHRKRKRTINVTQEMVHLQKGKIELYLFDSKGKKIKTLNLEEGDSVLFSAGGHGWKNLEDSKVIEVKQGPYFGVEKDKVYFGVVENEI